jgi:FMN phosphatase YigB (HAD superfamily)
MKSYQLYIFDLDDTLLAAYSPHNPELETGRRHLSLT